jgi:hypothetical protein
VLNNDGKFSNNPQAIASAFKEYFLLLVEEIYLSIDNSRSYGGGGDGGDDGGDGGDGGGGGGGGDDDDDGGGDGDSNDSPLYYLLQSIFK